MKRSSLARYVGGIGLITAPSRLAARNRRTSSLQLGSWHEMALPGVTPWARRPWAIRSTSRASCAYVYRPRPSTMAVLSGRSVAQRSR